MSKFLTADLRGKAIYYNDVVKCRLTSISYRVVDVELKSDDEVRLVCEPYRILSLANAVVMRRSMDASCIYSMNNSQMKQRKK